MTAAIFRMALPSPGPRGGTGLRTCRPHADSLRAQSQEHKAHVGCRCCNTISGRSHFSSFARGEAEVNGTDNLSSIILLTPGSWEILFAWPPAPWVRPWDCTDMPQDCIRSRSSRSCIFAADQAAATKVAEPVLGKNGAGMR
jgi:hypothetical protein